MNLNKIGIGITTRNRQDILQKSLKNFALYTPREINIVIVDDASTSPVSQASFTFQKRAGIAAAKNKCLALLNNKNCEEFFLFDDDCYPISDNWFYPYIENKEPHFSYNFINKYFNQNLTIFNDYSIKAFSHSTGAMLYCNKIVLEKVGGMDSVHFKNIGWEHIDWSNRIFAAGLTSYRFMDIQNSNQYIYCLDEDKKCQSSISWEERIQFDAINKSICENQKNNPIFYDFNNEKEKL